MHLVQFELSNRERRVGVVDNGLVREVQDARTVRDLALAAIEAGNTLEQQVQTLGLGISHDYAELLSQLRILPPLDHPDPAHMLISGTGLTHLGSASARDKMHQQAGDEAAMTDTMRIFKWGVEGGKPAAGQAGVQPEWFYKGDGSWLVGPGQPLPRPAFALDGGEEPELAGLYYIDEKGRPVRLGFALGNEYSDHVTERQNYLYLAHSKLRHSAIGPEMVLGKIPDAVEGMSRILRKGEVIWEKPFLTGEANMSHTLANLEYHHFKYDGFRRPGDLHIHYFGTATLSIADGIKTEDGDVFEIEAKPFGAALRNPLKAVAARHRPGSVKAL